MYCTCTCNSLSQFSKQGIQCPALLCVVFLTLMCAFGCCLGWGIGNFFLYCWCAMYMCFHVHVYMYMQEQGILTNSHHFRRPDKRSCTVRPFNVGMELLKSNLGARMLILYWGLLSSFCSIHNIDRFSLHIRRGGGWGKYTNLRMRGWSKNCSS